MDRLTAVRVFVAVTDHGSLTAAAEQLDMSTAMVSRYLAAVEDWLGSRLLHRTTRRIGLTESGQAALASCRQMLELSEELSHRTAELRREPSGRLRITASASFAETQLAPALVAFQQRHPKVAFSLVVGDQAVDLTAERVDLAVRITNRLEPLQIARPLARCRSVLCAAPAYLAEHGTPRTPEDVAGHRALTHQLVGATMFQMKRGGDTVLLTPAECLSTNDTAVMRSAVLAGAGLAVLPTYQVGEDLRAGRLVRLMPELEAETLGIHAIFLSRQHQPLALRLLVDFLAERFGGDVAPWDR